MSAAISKLIQIAILSKSWGLQDGFVTIVFGGEFGADIFRSLDVAVTKIGVAIAGFEGAGQLQPFSSKYDQFIQGKTVLFDNEKRGMLFFMDKKRVIASAVMP